MHTKFWPENLKVRGHTENLGRDAKVLEWILGKQGGKVWTGCILLKMGTSGELL